MSGKEPQTSKDFTKIILDNITDGVFTTTGDMRITSFNKAAEKITGVAREKAINEFCYDVFRTNVCEKNCLLSSTMKTGKAIVSKKIFIVNSDGIQIPISISTALLKDKQGKIIGGVETFRDQSAVIDLRKKLEGSYSYADIVSKNKEMNRIFDILPQIAESDSTVLIEGESGTGKDLFASVIHNLSSRKNKAMVAVNCGALPDTLLESELFGYKAGAFTDAKNDKEGRFAQAEESTILLDEIGDVSPAFQVRLLRVLQDHVYEPLGSNKPVRANVRVIAATNKNLSQLVEQGLFRSDLYYRINIIRIVIPPLRDRREDIPHLVKHFIGKYNNIMGKNIEMVSENVLKILMKYHFPGNVRELENIIERTMVLCRKNIIECDQLPDELTQQFNQTHIVDVINPTVKDVERKTILDCLEKNCWNRLATAKELGMHKTTLFRKIKKLDICLPSKDGRFSK
ncbi:MAG: PAS domain-containing protein [Calditrichaeota bacterium]|nr:MAG: PAS domain-containing protein [Calditrichota bacterium]MBL1205165.1 PAS domain-containing protein [Calditrichota bacterium]NOG44995.1 sigma 54-interacting transcriptional regulator [Calditrichota bacterium]